MNKIRINTILIDYCWLIERKKNDNAVSWNDDIIPKYYHPSGGYTLYTLKGDNIFTGRY